MVKEDVHAQRPRIPGLQIIVIIVVGVVYRQVGFHSITQRPQNQVRPIPERVVGLETVRSKLGQIDYQVVIIACVAVDAHIIGLAVAARDRHGDALVVRPGARFRQQMLLGVVDLQVQVAQRMAEENVHVERSRLPGLQKVVIVIVGLVYRQVGLGQIDRRSQVCRRRKAVVGLKTVLGRSRRAVDHQVVIGLCRARMATNTYVIGLPPCNVQRDTFVVRIIRVTPCKMLLVRVVDRESQVARRVAEEDIHVQRARIRGDQLVVIVIVRLVYVQVGLRQIDQRSQVRRLLEAVVWLKTIRGGLRAVDHQVVAARVAVMAVHKHVVGLAARDRH